jgi:hypothetical protein
MFFPYFFYPIKNSSASTFIEDHPKVEFISYTNFIGVKEALPLILGLL